MVAVTAAATMPTGVRDLRVYALSTRRMVTGTAIMARMVTDAGLEVGFEDGGYKQPGCLRLLPAPNAACSMLDYVCKRRCTNVSVPYAISETSQKVMELCTVIEARQSRCNDVLVSEWHALQFCARQQFLCFHHHRTALPLKR